MALYPKGLPVVSVSIALISLVLGLVVLTALALYGIPQLFVLDLGNVTIKTSSSISIFTSITPMEIAYSLNAMGFRAVPEVVILGVVNQTPVVIRGVDPSYLRYYGINASMDELRRGALVGYELARELGVSTNDVLILTSFTNRSVQTIVSGIIYSTRFPQLNYEVIVNLTTAQYLRNEPPTAVSIIYVNASEKVINSLNENYLLNIRISVHNATLTILNSMNNTIVNQPAGNISLELPFGTYYVILHRGPLILWYEEVVLDRNTTITIAKPSPVNTTVPTSSPTSWVYVRWPNGSLLSTYYLAVSALNGSQVLYGLAHGPTPIALPQGMYRFTVIIGSIYQSVVAEVRPHSNITITITPYTTLISGLSTYAPAYLPKLGALSVSSGPATLLSVLRVGFASIIAVLTSLIIVMTLGIVGVVKYYYDTNMDLIDYLKLHRAGKTARVLTVDLPVALTMVITTSLGLTLAYTAWPPLMRLLDISIVNEPLYLVHVDLTTYMTTYPIITSIMIIMQVIAALWVRGHG